MTLAVTSPLVSTQWLHTHLQDPSLRVLDCAMIMQRHDDGSFAFVGADSQWEQGHIPGSIYVNVAAELSDPTASAPLMMPSPELLAARMQHLGVGDNTAVVLYDHGNHAWAARVWWMLRTAGFDNAAVLNGGWGAWQREGRPVSTALQTYPAAAQFTVHHRPQLMVDKARVVQALDEPATVLMHSLSYPMFTGEISPYGKAGRIPGSQHLFCESLLDPDTGCFLDNEALREKVAATTALEAATVITYCGGGIAASINALALSLLGVQQVAVYDGSLSEWTEDDSLAMETGPATPVSQ